MARTVDITRETYQKLVTEHDNAERDVQGFKETLEVLESLKNDENAEKLSKPIHMNKIGLRNAAERVTTFDEARKRFVLRAIVKNSALFAKCEKEVLNTIPAK